MRTGVQRHCSVRHIHEQPGDAEQQHADTDHDHRQPRLQSSYGHGVCHSLATAGSQRRIARSPVVHRASERSSPEVHVNP